MHHGRCTFISTILHDISRDRFETLQCVCVENSVEKITFLLKAFQVNINAGCLVLHWEKALDLTYFVPVRINRYKRRNYRPISFNRAALIFSLGYFESDVMLIHLWPLHTHYHSSLFRQHVINAFTVLMLWDPYVSVSPPSFSSIFL